jgi:hypothetical protein
MRRVMREMMRGGLLGGFGGKLLSSVMGRKSNRPNFTKKKKKKR